jgi:hypothetical protein
MRIMYVCKKQNLSIKILSYVFTCWLIINAHLLFLRSKKNTGDFILKNKKKMTLGKSWIDSSVLLTTLLLTTLAACTSSLLCCIVGNSEHLEEWYLCYLTISLFHIQGMCLTLFQCIPICTQTVESKKHSGSPNKKHVEDRISQFKDKINIREKT